MVIDSSVIVSILSNEPEGAEFVVRIATDRTRLLSAANYLETTIVLRRRFRLCLGQSF